MIQILGLRNHKGKTSTYFFNEKWRAPSVDNLLLNLDTYLKEIPDKEHYNLHFTLANC